jgi:uncharacterized membrane protein YgaE (UPF0421/DUF939 family)
MTFGPSSSALPCEPMFHLAGTAMRIRQIVVGSQLALRAAVAGTVSFYLATFFNLQHPIYALVAAIIVTDFSPAETTRLGAQRLAATGIGAVCGVVLSGAFGQIQWIVGLGILIAMILCHASNISAGAKVAGYVCALVILNDGEDPWMHARYRVIETVVGIAVAWTLSLVPRLIRLEEPADPEKRT